MSRVVVVGGGISGLAAAFRLRDAVDASGAPVEVVVVEATGRVGGKLDVADVGGVAVDQGAEMVLTRTPEAADLVHAAGLADHLTAPRTAAASVWAHGQLVPLPAGTVLGIPSALRPLRGVLTPAERLRAAADRVLPGDPPGEVDVAVGRWVRRRLGDAVADLLVDPLLGGVYAGRADELSLQATVPQLDRRHRSALAAARATLAAGAAATRSGPAFATLDTGLGALPQAVLDASGARLVAGRAVRAVERTATGWRVVHGAAGDEQALDADAVVIAVPPAPAARLLQPVVPAAAADLAAIEAASLAIVTTVWHRADAPPTSGSGYLVPAVTRPRRPVKAVTFASAKWLHLDLPDRVVVRCSLGRHRDTRDLHRDDADLVALAVAELTGYAGFTGRPVAACVTRWGGGLPQYAVGHRDRVARIRRAVGAAPGLAVCGAAYDGVGVPACIRTGYAAAEGVRRFLTGATRTGVSETR